jgi:hypothetical protein
MKEIKSLIKGEKHTGNTVHLKKRGEESIFKTFKIQDKIINMLYGARELGEILRVKTPRIVFLGGV